MRIRRLGWAGVEVEAGGRTAVIDLLEDTEAMAPWIGSARRPLPPPEAGGGAVALALLTHLHADHADVAALGRALAPDGVVLRPARAGGDGLETAAVDPVEHALGRSGLDVRVVEPWESVTVGPFTATALPAADGFGDPQVSWVLAAGDRRIVHAGDTLFHGWWWLAALRHGPFDAAFLPVNGPVVRLPHRRPASPLPAAMDPAQAAVAAAALGVPLAVPIHYDTLHREPVYVQVGDPAGTFATAARAAGVDARVLTEGEVLDLAA